jgi:hypothetical protein
MIIYDLDKKSDDELLAISYGKIPHGFLNARSTITAQDIVIQAKIILQERQKKSKSVDPASMFSSTRFGDHTTIVVGDANRFQIVSYSRDDLDDLRRLVEVFDKHLDDLALDAAAKRKAEAQVATIKAQLKDEPDPVIVKQAGRTLRNITEGAIGSLIAAAAQPTVWATATALSAKLFGGP